jgi:integrase
MAQRKANTKRTKRKTQHLTDAVIRRLPAPAKGNKINYDDEVKGLGCRVTAAGAKSFVLNYLTKGGRERRITIGSCADWTCTEARAEAKRLRHIVDQGGDPLADIQDARAAPTVAELADRFEQEHLSRKRASTAHGYRHMLAAYIRPALGHLKVAEVTFSDVDALHRKITKSGSPYAGNRVVAVLSKMFSSAMRWNMRESNPTKGIERNLEQHRRRYLSTDELARLVAALAAHPDTQAANIVRLLLLTGARKGEALSCRWDSVDLTAGVWSKPPSSTKQKAYHEAQLSAPARQLLSEIREQQVAKHPKKPLGEYVFPSSSESGHVVDIKKSWRQLCRAAKIDGLRIHDLRHSFASQAISGGAGLPLVGALLGHASPTTTARYAHMFTDPQKAAVERIGAVYTAAGKPATEVVPLKRRGRHDG